MLLVFISELKKKRPSRTCKVLLKRDSKLMVAIESKQSMKSVIGNPSSFCGLCSTQINDMGGLSELDLWLFKWKPREEQLFSAKSCYFQ
jgi:hypothetical protein